MTDIDAETAAAIGAGLITPIVVTTMGWIMFSVTTALPSADGVVVGALTEFVTILGILYVVFGWVFGVPPVLAAYSAYRSTSGGEQA